IDTVSGRGIAQEGRRTEQHPVHDGEHRHIRTNADSQRQDYADRGGRDARQCADRVTQVLNVMLEHYFSLTRSTLSYRVMSVRITESPAASPSPPSTPLTDVRPPFTGTRTA